jgi:hypothetical protein
MGHQIVEPHLLPLLQAVLSRPCREPMQLHCVGANGVVRQPSLQPQVLQEIIDQLVHETKLLIHAN